MIYLSIIYSKPVFKLVAVVLSILLIILSLLSGTPFYFLSTIAENGVGEKEEEQQQQFRGMVAVTSTTKQSGLLQSISFDQNISEQRDSITSPKLFNSDLGIETYNKNNWITVNHDIYGTRASNQTIIKIGDAKFLWLLLIQFFHFP